MASRREYPGVTECGEGGSFRGYPCLDTVSSERAGGKLASEANRVCGEGSFLRVMFSEELDGIYSCARRGRAGPWLLVVIYPRVFEIERLSPRRGALRASEPRSNRDG
jgi:hypothetical protein